jgi:hypothetical protein
MAFGLETAIGGVLISVFGNPIFFALFIVMVFGVMMVFGRVGIIASTPVMIGAFILAFEFMPQFKVPLAIAMGIIVGYGFYRIYRG